MIVSIFDIMKENIFLIRNNMNQDRDHKSVFLNPVLILQIRQAMELRFLSNLIPLIGCCLFYEIF
jgi:hypothetical protein